MNETEEPNATHSNNSLTQIAEDFCRPPILTDPPPTWHVLMNSRRYGTSAFACKHVVEASQTMAWLAIRAEKERKMDGAQRFFCLLPPTSSMEEATAPVPQGPDRWESEDAMVVCLAEGALQWIAADNLEERPLIVLEAVGSEVEGPFVCWQACPRPLRQMAHLHRHAVSRYLHLRRLRQQDEPDSRTIAATAEEGNGLVDPVVSAWQQNEADETQPLLTFSAVVETHPDHDVPTEEARR